MVVSAASLNSAVGSAGHLTIERQQGVQPSCFVATGRAGCQVLANGGITTARERVRQILSQLLIGQMFLHDVPSPSAACALLSGRGKGVLLPSPLQASSPARSPRESSLRRSAAGKPRAVAAEAGPPPTIWPAAPRARRAVAPAPGQGHARPLRRLRRLPDSTSQTYVARSCFAGCGRGRWPSSRRCAPATFRYSTVRES